MGPRRGKRVSYEVIELGGVRYAVVPESLLCELAHQAGYELVVPEADRSPGRGVLAGIEELDDQTLARRLIARRKGMGLTQADLARRAGIRVETLNRVERAKTTPDFATLRKLVVAMKQAERALGD